MYIFDRSGYDNDLHKIYLKTKRNPATSVELEIQRLSNDDETLYDELFAKYVDKYGYECTTTAAKDGYVYLMQAEGFFGVLSPIMGRFKIGKSNNPKRRHVELNGMQAPCPIRIIRYIQVDDMSTVESQLHKRFQLQRRHDEWFNFWTWELPLLHLAFGKYQRDFRCNKMASLPSAKSTATAIGTLAFLLVASAFVSSLFAQSAPAPATRTPITRTK